MPVTNEKDLNRQIQDAKEMILMLLEMDDGEKRELKRYYDRLPAG